MLVISAQLVIQKHMVCLCVRDKCECVVINKGTKQKPLDMLTSLLFVCVCVYACVFGKKPLDLSTFNPL